MGSPGFSTSSLSRLADGGTQTRAACPAPGPEAPHPTPLAPAPPHTPTPAPRLAPGTELQETLSGSSHCSRGPLRLHYCPVLPGNHCSSAAAAQRSPPRPAPGVRGKGPRNCLCLYPDSRSSSPGDAPSPPRPIPGTPLRCTTGFEEGVPQPLTATQVPPASPGVGGGSGRLGRKRGGGGEGVGFQAAG